MSYNGHFFNILRQKHKARGHAVFQILFFAFSVINKLWTDLSRKMGPLVQQWHDCYQGNKPVFDWNDIFFLCDGIISFVHFILLFVLLLVHLIPFSECLTVLVKLPKQIFFQNHLCFILRNRAVSAQPIFSWSYGVHFKEGKVRLTVK